MPKPKHGGRKPPAVKLSIAHVKLNEAMTGLWQTRTEGDEVSFKAYQTLVGHWCGELKKLADSLTLKNGKDER